MSGHLLFKLGTADAGHETFRVERVTGGYRIVGDVDLQAMGYHIVQQLEVDAGERLEFRSATVRATVNDETSLVTLRRRNGEGVQELTTNDSTVTQNIATPEGSVLLTNNVIHHMVQFAWLHDGAVGETREFVAFPRVPVTVRFEYAGMVTKAGATLSVRRYFLNLANTVGLYVWLADDGAPLKILVPLQAFEAVSEAHQEWSDALSPTQSEPAPEPASEDGYEAEELTSG
ncbi:MAG: hypothetical protein JSV86_03160 [Gemmatimonadota bacterium]|nr:MAG: hypothetical protein JSV86_03160 [Gemmatimonadota bacterium]